MANNPTIFQAFEWYSTGTESQVVNADPRHKSSQSFIAQISYWTRLKGLIPQLSECGITTIWIPPACKATNPEDNGYGIYDLYDLGEFDAKGSISTKWGTKLELQSLCAEAQSFGIGVLFDAVLNHRAAPDEPEECYAVQVDPHNRMKAVDRKARAIEAWTKFNYTARNGRYSTLKYSSVHFSGVDWDHKTREKGIFQILGTRADGSTKDWAIDVGLTENGNYDYLMFADLDYGSAEVCQDVKTWGSWVMETLPGISGFRLDAIKHYSASFQREFIQHILADARHRGQTPFFVGEYWLSDSNFLASHLDRMFGNTNLHLFDAKLMYNFHDLSTGKSRDLRKVYSKSLVRLRPNQAVTFVTNHDTQETQSLAAPVEPWFIPHAYAMILLRQEGIPCVFWGDVFGTNGPCSRVPACGGRLMRLVMARKYYAYGQQDEYFDDPQCVGWVRSGIRHKDRVGIAVLVNTAWAWRRKKMSVGKSAASQVWTDVMGWAWSGVLIDENGHGDFVVGPRSISVWTWKDAPHRRELDNLVYPTEIVENTELVHDFEHKMHV